MMTGRLMGHHPLSDGEMVDIFDSEIPAPDSAEELPLGADAPPNSSICEGGGNITHSKVSRQRWAKYVFGVRQKWIDVSLLLLRSVA